MSNEIQEAQISQDQEAVNKYKSGDLNESDLTSAQVELAVQSYNEEPTTQEPAGTTVEPVAESINQTPSEEVHIPAQHHIDMRNSLAAKNSSEQRAKNAEDKLKRMQEDAGYANKVLGIEAKYTPDPKQDMLDDDYLGKIGKHDQDITDLKAELASYRKKDETREADEKVKTANDGLFNEIGRLQDEFSEFKTDLPFKQFNDKYNGFYQTMTEGGKDITRYATDEAYRQQLDQAGYKPEFSVSDLQKGLKLYDGVAEFNKDKTDGYRPNFKSAFQRTTHFSKAYDNKHRMHELADEQALNDRVRDINAQPQVMSGTGSAPSVSTFDSLMAELENRPSRARLAEIEAEISKLM